MNHVKHKEDMKILTCFTSGTRLLIMTLLMVFSRTHELSAPESSFASICDHTIWSDLLVQNKAIGDIRVIPMLSPGHFQHTSYLHCLCLAKPSM